MHRSPSANQPEPYRYESRAQLFEDMESWVLDIVVGIMMLVLFFLLLIALPLAVGTLGGYAYLFAIIVFVAAMSGAGYVISQKGH